MDKPNYKHSLIMACASACKSAQNKIYILTAAGIIEGTYISSGTEESLKSDVVYNFHNGLDKSARKISDSPSEEILLKNAVVKSSSDQFSFEYLHVFIDDIIAVTIGNSSETV